MTGLIGRKPVLKAGLALAALAVAVYLWKGNSNPTTSVMMFTARRGPLNITIVEGGSIQAIESQEVRSEIKGYQGTKILKIVEEGYAVTEEDVRTNKVLVELDSSEIRKQITQQDIQFESTAASLIDAQQAYDIQVNQNESDVKAAEQKTRFARMDFEKYMGSKAAHEIIEQLELDREEKASNTPPKLALSDPGTGRRDSLAGIPAGTNGPLILLADVRTASDARLDVGGGLSVSLPAKADCETNTTAQVGSEAKPSVVTPTNEAPRTILIDFSKYAKVELLGDGEAKQKIRKFDDDLQVAEKERLLTQSTWEGTKRLFDKEFATRTELDNDDLKLQNTKLKVQTAETARHLFLAYEFPKTAEETLSKYAEAVRELGRSRKGAVSKMAQAEAKLKSAQGKYNLESRQRNELQDQLEKCSIKAKRQGLVVYGAGQEDGMYYGEERIREGATVRERQAIITIPDTSKMSVRVKIHESYIKKVQKGQKAKITIDAFPDDILEGEVIKVGVLPDSQNRWMNPDLKVYLTTIRIEGVHSWLKPGMSAKVEVMVKRLPEVTYVPIQAVASENGKHFCYIGNSSKQQRREVEVGEFTDDFIEVKSGIKEGEQICLRTPAPSEKSKEEGNGASEPNKDKGEKPRPEPASPAAKGPVAG